LEEVVPLLERVGIDAARLGLAEFVALHAAHAGERGG